MAVLRVAAIFILLGLLAFYHFTKPPHQRTSPFGKKWVLPKGPKGPPILGSLFELRKFRKDPNKVLEWVSVNWSTRAMLEVC